ncbi:MAG: SDR family oxidoreductase [Sphingomonadales bacterium]
MTKPSILITGAAKRIGRSLALDLGKAGHPIVVHFRASTKEAQATVEEINAAGGNAVSVKADLANSAETSGLLNSAAKALGQPIEILINNAGAFVRDDLATFTSKTYSINMATNLEAPIVLCQQFTKQLPENIQGNIINIIDQRVLGVSGDFLTYSVSKHALYALTKILALELAPKIRVNAIGPGPTFKNEFQSEEDFTNEAKGVPLGKGSDLGEFSKTVTFILSTPSMTGQMIALDGGQHLN